MSEIKPTQSQEDRMEHYLRFLQAGSNSEKTSGVSLHNQSDAALTNSKLTGVPALVVGGINLGSKSPDAKTAYNCPECQSILTANVSQAPGRQATAGGFSCASCGYSRRVSQFRAPRPDPTTDYSESRRYDTACPSCNGAHMNPVEVGGSIQMVCDNPYCGHMEPAKPY